LELINIGKGDILTPFVDDIIKKYTDNHQSLKRIGSEYGVKYRHIRKVLVDNGVKIKKSGGTRQSIDTLYKNMKNHLHWNIELDFLKQFQDFNKLKAVNRLLNRDRVSVNFDDKKYKDFVCKFYYDAQFNNVYRLYLDNNKSSWAMPSLDHIVPLSRGGTWELDNLQVLSWAENRAKYNYLQSEWDYIKTTFITKKEGD
jgi:5-methylcytosine-specific restriction endonuclease McrA